MASTDPPPNARRKVPSAEKWLAGWLRDFGWKGPSKTADCDKSAGRYLTFIPASPGTHMNMNKYIDLTIYDHKQMVTAGCEASCQPHSRL